MRGPLPPLVCALLLVISACGDDATGTVDDAPTAPPVLEAVEFIPMAVTDLDRDVVRVRAFVRGDPSTVRLGVRNTRQDVSLERTEETATVATVGGPAPAEIWEATVPARDLAAGFSPRTGANFIGRIEAANALGPVSVAVSLPFVEDAPAVAVEQLMPGVQISDHVVNLRYDPDEMLQFMAHLPALPDAARVLDALSLAPDFLAMAGPVWKLSDPGRAFYHEVRNDTRGIGRELRDLSDRADIGFDPLASHPSVDGIYVMRNPSLFDLASGNAVHEIGHRFIAFLHDVHGDPGGFHWPVSDLAVGVMGYQLGQVSERFGFRIAEHPDGGFVYEQAEVEHRFNSMELYLMGLLPAEKVDSFRIFDVDPTTLPAPRAGRRIEAPVRWIDADSVAAVVGPREPAWPDAPREFRVVSFILSRGRLLTPAEMAWADMAAARGEAREPLPPLEVVSGEELPPALPFHVATHELGTLVTRLRR